MQKNFYSRQSPWYRKCQVFTFLLTTLYLQAESYFRLLSPHIPVICLKIEEQYILLYVPLTVCPSIFLSICPSICLQLIQTAKNCQYAAGRHCGWLLIHEGTHLFAGLDLFFAYFAFRPILSILHLLMASSWPSVTQISAFISPEPK